MSFLFLAVCQPLLPLPFLSFIPPLSTSCLLPTLIFLAFNQFTFFPPSLRRHRPPLSSPSPFFIRLASPSFPSTYSPCPSFLFLSLYSQSLPLDSTLLASGSWCNNTNSHILTHQKYFTLRLPSSLLYYSPLLLPLGVFHLSVWWQTVASCFRSY